ncbi:MAG TPA: T9SS type A sorting domain-containing protein, partial [Chitinophagaceae bacterium]|nr:T9SS type A sorting domain-containing protein [Chitinophagaceae bacterium]
ANSTTTCYRLRAEINGIPKAAWGQSTVARGDINSVTVFPNPARAKLNISYTAAESRAEQATITDITGKKVLINTINSIPGKNDHGIILPSHLAKGIYFLQIGTRTPVKFVKG